MKPIHILIVEDEHKIARALAKALEQETYAVDIAYDGDEGYAMATTEPYDVAVIDRLGHQQLPLIVLTIEFDARRIEFEFGRMRHDCRAAEKDEEGTQEVAS